MRCSLSWWIRAEGKWNSDAFFLEFVRSTDNSTHTQKGKQKQMFRYITYDNSIQHTYLTGKFKAKAWARILLQLWSSTSAVSGAGESKSAEKKNEVELGITIWHFFASALHHPPPLSTPTPYPAPERPLALALVFIPYYYWSWKIPEGIFFHVINNWQVLLPN